jgi:hypothetical protein
MALDLWDEKGTPVDQQRFTWRELVQKPFSKLNDDAFTRVRVILMNGLEAQSLRFKHIMALMNRDLRLDLARVRRADHHQQTMINWLLPPDQSPLETTIGYEQVAIEVTAAIAMQEPDSYLAQVYRFGLLEDFDHMYRYAALMDRVEGRDANNILQSYTDIIPGRPTAVEHRHPVDDVRSPYDCKTADPLSKIHAYTLMGAEYQTHDYYMTIGPTFTDPVARQLYAEIASIEEQHVTQYGSLIDPNESWLEKWLLHEAMELYNYYTCLQHEDNPRIKSLWERCCDYELGQLHHVIELFQRHEGRDPAEVLPKMLPEPYAFESHREFVRETLNAEVDCRAVDSQIVDGKQMGESRETVEYRRYMNSDGSPSESVAAGYVWCPGTELDKARTAA